MARPKTVDVTEAENNMADTIPQGYVGQTIDFRHKIIQVRSAKLHAPLFLATKNLSDTLDVEKQSGLYLSYNMGLRLLYIEYNGGFAFTDTASSITPCNPEDVGYIMKGKQKPPQVVTNVTHSQIMGSSRTAQVGDPTGVFNPLVK